MSSRVVSMPLPENGGIRVCREDISTFGKPFLLRGILLGVEGLDVDPELGSPVAWVRWDGRDFDEEERLEAIGPDFDDDNAFAFVLRWLWMRKDREANWCRPVDWTDIRAGLFMGELDDRDRHTVREALSAAIAAGVV